MKKIKVLVVDDSALIRQVLSEILNQAGDIEVVGTAQDPIFAMEKISRLKPDVITLDVEMPRMDGLTFLGKLMKSNPIPVLMVSALTQKDARVTIEALELGAIDYIQKPTIDVAKGVVELGEEIVRKVRIAANARAKIGAGGRRPRPVPSICGFSTTDKIIAIGASTGGTKAITDIVSTLPETTPGVVIVQHMPPAFTRSFAKRLNSLSRLDVKEASTGDRIVRGTVLIAPGNKHLVIRRNGAMYYTEVKDGPMVNFVRPSVDVLFNSVAEQAGRNAVGVILTGMGEDGAKGLLEMKRKGAFTIAQDEASSIVFGMPKKAIEIGAAERVASLEEIPRIIMEGLSRNPS